MDKIRWYHFWDLDSGIIGGVLFALITSTWGLIILALIKYLRT